MTRRTYRILLRLWLATIPCALLGWLSWWIPAAPILALAVYGCACVAFTNQQAPQWRENS